VVMEASVPSGAVAEEGGDRHVEYSVCASIRSLEHTRRYTEFKELDAALRQRFPGLELPTLPDVSWRFKLFSRRTLDPAYVAEKGRLLNAYLGELFKWREVRQSPEFLAFLFLPKKPVAGAAASNGLAPPSSATAHGPALALASQHVLQPQQSQHAPPQQSQHAPPQPQPQHDKGHPAHGHPAQQHPHHTPHGHKHSSVLSGSEAGDDWSSDEEDDPSASPAPGVPGPAAWSSSPAPAAAAPQVDLIERPRGAFKDHPFLPRLASKRQPISLPRYKSRAEILDTSVLVVRLDRFDGVEIAFASFALNSNNILTGKACLDGHRVRIDAQLTSFNPISGLANISPV
jgi:hypothetical protein